MRMKKLNSYILLISISFITLGCNSTKNSGNNELVDEIDIKVEELIKEMTLDEKIGQMNQYNGFMDFTGPTPQNGFEAVKYENIRKGLVGAMLNVHGVENVRAVQKIAVEETRLGIPLLFGFDVIHGFKTISPIPLAEAASWDLEAIKKSAQIAAEEASAAGINWTFAPMVDISRDARWGRVMEGAGEDPYLGSLIAKARVEGFQGVDLTSEKTLAACAKHFAAYGFAEAGRDYNTADLGTSTLYNTVLPPFKAALESDVKTFMNGFNILNGIPSTGDAFLQRDILKGKWEFDGFVVSDWGSITEMIPHGFAKDGKEAAKLAILAGSDMDMESYLYVTKLAELVKNGEVDEALIDDAVRRILRVKFELGLFDDPYKYCDLERETATIGKQSFHDEVLEIAKKSIVLLKNENNLLPLQKSGQKIAVIGPLAADKTSPLGSWRIGADDETAVSVLEGFKKYNSTNQISYAKGADLILNKPLFTTELEINTSDTSGFGEAIQTAKNADVIVMVLGEHGFQSGEGRSRTNLDLPGVQQQLLEEVYNVNKNVVLVLQNGRPLTINWASENIPSIVVGWHLGTQSGNALAQVLYGDYNPSGKLPMTFPRNVGQLPLYYNYYNTGRPVEPAPNQVFWSHYIDESNDPLYPFGYGLSYTSFEYDQLEVTNKFSENNVVEVLITVKNTGNTSGKETAQLYIKDLYSSVVKPVRALKGFQQIELEPGETRTLQFLLTEQELGFYDNSGNWVVEPGTFEVFVGGNSKAILSKQFEI